MSLQDYLREQGLIQSMLALEQESKQMLFNYSKEMAFLRQIILDGNWTDVEKFLKPAQSRVKEEFHAVVFEIRKQKYLEMLDCDSQVEQDVMVNALKDLEGLCSQELYNNLCYLLSLQKIQDHPEFAYWSVQKGRLECFEKINKCLAGIYQTQEKRKVPANRLTKIIKDSVLHQYYIAKHTGQKTKFRFDPMTQSSEVSLVKDIISQENQAKFHGQYLSEVQLKFYQKGRVSPQGQQLNTWERQEQEDQEEFIEEDLNDEEEDEESQSDCYEDQYAQSMPAHFHSQLPKQKPKNQANPTLSQSINANAFQNKKLSMYYENQQHNNSQFQPVAMKGVHRGKHSFDSSQHNESTSSANMFNKGQGKGPKKGPQNYQNLEFQRPTPQTQQIQFTGQAIDPHQFYDNTLPSQQIHPHFFQQDYNSVQPKSRPQPPKYNQNVGSHQQYHPPHFQGSQIEMLPKHSKHAYQGRQYEQEGASYGEKGGQNEFFHDNDFSPIHDPNTSRKQPQLDSEQEEELKHQLYLNPKNPHPHFNVSSLHNIDHHQFYDPESEHYDEPIQQNKGRESCGQSERQIIDTDENPNQIISDIEPVIDTTMSTLTQKAILVDGQPIRTACFSPKGDYIVLGTNSKSLKICSLPPNLFEEDDDEGSAEERDSDINVIFEQQNHHSGSLYCVDWSRTSRLIASGSNDKTIKLLVCPDFGQDDHQELLEMVLEGHQAIVRTLCFNPINDLILLSGGIIDTDVKMWDSETGKNVANLRGHKGSIYSIKILPDGSSALSVGTDRVIQVWDLRVNQSVASIDGTHFKDMNDISFAPSLSSSPASASPLSSILSGLASVAHNDGTISYWDLNMRKCLTSQKIHSSQEVRGVSFSVDGKYLASAGFDQMVNVVDTSDLDNLGVVKSLAHEDKVVSVKWHPYRPVLLSTSADKTARIWGPQSK